MQVDKLRLKDFRNIKTADFEFDGKMNVICGENAQGKTNVIEISTDNHTLACNSCDGMRSNESVWICFGCGGELERRIYMVSP